jgi:hypothetical protein
MSIELSRPNNEVIGEGAKVLKDGSGKTQKRIRARIAEKIEALIDWKRKYPDTRQKTSLLLRTVKRWVTPISQ